MADSSATANNSAGGASEAHTRGKRVWVIAFLTVIISIIIAGLVAVSIKNASPQQSQLSPAVLQLCEAVLQWQLDDLPQFATQVGDFKNAHLMNNFSLEAFDKRLAKVNEFLTELDQLQPTVSDRHDVINVKVLRDYLETFRDGFKFRGFLTPVNGLEGIRKTLPHTLGFMPRNTPQDYEKMLTRLEATAAQADQMIALMREGVRAGITMHHHSVKNVPSEIDTFLVETPEDSSIYKKFFVKFPENFSEDEKTNIQKRAKDIIGNWLTPAMRRLRDYLATEYQTRPQIAVTSLPDGKARYDMLIKINTGSTKTPREIHEIGLSEVARIENLMQQVAVQEGHNVSAQEFSSLIRIDEANFFKSEKEQVAGATEAMNKATNKLLTIFNSPPATDCVVKADPTSTSAYYMSTDRAATRPGEFHIGTKSLRAWPRYGILSLTLHEANPGHHYQSAYAMASPNIPGFRNFRSGYMNYGFNPSAFPTYASYVEGWGLYSEKLGFDMGLYEDPLDRYGHYSAEIFRACRLVVDTGMHALGWTRDQAIDYMLQHSAKTRVQVENEVDRYIGWPGQALAYKMGQLHISEMREKAEQELGSSFDLKAFHDVILDVLGPLDLVEQEVNRWKKEVKQM